MNVQNKPVAAAAAAGVVVGAIVVALVSTVILDGKADHSREWRPVMSAQALHLSSGVGTSLIPPVHPLDSEPGGDDLARIASLEHRIEAIAGSLSRSQVDFAKQSRFNDAEVNDEEASADQFDIDDARHYELESWEEKRQSFAAEPLDKTWGLKARDAIESDVWSIAQGHGLTVVDADCRTTLGCKES